MQVGAFYGIGQLIGGSLGGSLSDKRGRKPTLLLSFAGSCLFYGFLGIVWDLPFLLFCRLGIGLVKQTVSITEVYITDITTPAERIRGMAMNSVAIGAGFIVGPVMGSLISRFYDPVAPFFVASFLFACNFVCTHYWLPESKQKKKIEAPHMLSDKMKMDNCPAMRTTSVEGGMWPHLKNLGKHMRVLHSEQPAMFCVIISRFLSSGAIILIEG